jgi:hypothetical protein
MASARLRHWCYLLLCHLRAEGKGHQEPALLVCGAPTLSQEVISEALNQSLTAIVPLEEALLSDKHLGFSVYQLPSGTGSWGHSPFTSLR